MNIIHYLRVTLPALVLGMPLVALAQGFKQQVGFQGTAGGSDLVGSITNLINIFLVLAALVAAIFLIIGGIRYIISGAEESGQEKAKNQILYAIIGLVVIGLAAVIVNFVVNSIT